jgi:hypothetical protein
MCQWIRDWWYDHKLRKEADAAFLYRRYTPIEKMRRAYLGAFNQRLATLTIDEATGPTVAVNEMNKRELTEIDGAAVNPGSMITIVEEYR